MMRVLFICLAFLLLAACSKESTDNGSTGQLPLLWVPVGFPEPLFPADNEFTTARFALGKRLFYDTVMSRDSSVSCASCHDPQRAFSDSAAYSTGSRGRAGTRNAPTLTNVAYQPYFTREGGVPTLEMQILIPIQEHNEFDFNLLLIAERLRTDTAYIRMSREAYGRDPDYFTITRSIACFERALISGNSRFDQYHFQGNGSVLAPAEKRGMELFFSDRTNCSVCHQGFNFTNYSFENNGLYEVYPDPGRYRLTGDTSDLARFKVPTLRNVSLTAPYMHDGSISSLKQVVRHYNSGGKNHPHRSALNRPMGLTEREMDDLVSFLESLTDNQFISNSNFKR
jgi:cytochrome c peroxidase